MKLSYFYGPISGLQHKNVSAHHHLRFWFANEPISQDSTPLAAVLVDNDVTQYSEKLPPRTISFD